MKTWKTWCLALLTVCPPIVIASGCNTKSNDQPTSSSATQSSAAQPSAAPLRTLSRDEALALLNDMGAQVVLDPEDKTRVLQAHPTIHKYEWDVKDEDLAALAAFPELREVSLEANTQIGDEGVRYLAGLTNLQHLNLRSTKVTGAGLAHLKNLANLQWLELFNTQIKGPDLVHLEGLSKLETLDLNGLPITDTDLAPLKKLTGLKEVTLSFTQVTEAGVEDLKKALPGADVWGP
jgi:hypothetical protein